MFVMFNLLLEGLPFLMLREHILELQYMFPQSLSFLKGLAQYLDFGIVDFGWLSDVHILREVFICDEFFLLLSKGTATFMLLVVFSVTRINIFIFIFQK